MSYHRRSFYFWLGLFALDLVGLGIVAAGGIIWATVMLVVGAFTFACLFGASLSVWVQCEWHEGYIAGEADTGLAQINDWRESQ